MSETSTAVARGDAAAEAPARVVYLGNHDAIDNVVHPDDTEAAAAAEERPVHRLRRPLPGKRCTTVTVPAGTPLSEAFTTVSHGSLWSAHSDADTPAWVASTDPLLGQLLASHWGCEQRDPDPDHQPAPAGGDDDTPEG